MGRRKTCNLRIRYLLTSEANEFINSIKKGTKSLEAIPDDAIKLMKVIDQIYTFK